MAQTRIKETSKRHCNKDVISRSSGNVSGGSRHGIRKTRVKTTKLFIETIVNTCLCKYHQNICLSISVVDPFQDINRFICKTVSDKITPKHMMQIRDTCENLSLWHDCNE